MIFDSHYWLIAIIAGAIAAILTFLFSADNKKWATILSSVTTVLLVRLIMYYGQPSFTGSFFGAFELILATLVPSFIFTWAMGNPDELPARRFFRFYLWSAVVLFTVPTVQYGTNAWGSANAKRFVAQAKVRVASMEEKMPPSDPQHMVLVTKSIAAFRGQSAMTTATGNLSSRYRVDADNYDLQGVDGHRYWIAPLEFANTSDQLNFNEPESPGYVVVDAEDPEKPAIVKLGFHMTIFDDGDFGQNLKRLLYQDGYTEGKFLDPKFEVDDNWNPHWVVSYAIRPFGGITGLEISKVLVVDVSQRQPKIAAYDLNKQPKWVDRVMCKDLLEEYVENWGEFGGSYAQEHYWSVFFNWRKDGTIQAADWDLNYTTDEHSIWVVPMTSRNGNSNGATGVLVYETSRDSAVFYPGLRGFSAGPQVAEVMKHARDNIKGYDVENVQLYSIYGELTWVAIYTAPQSIGASFAGIGLLHSNLANPSDVIVAPDLATALARYSSNLASHSGGNNTVSRTVKLGKEVSGKIARIANLPNIQGTPTYIFTVEGDSSSYVISRETYKLIPLVNAGDSVDFRYLEAPGADMNVSEFSCKNLLINNTKKSK